MDSTERQKLKELVYIAHLKYPDHPMSRYREINLKFPKSGHTILRYIKEFKGTERGKDLEREAKVVTRATTKKVTDFLKEDSLATITILRTLKEAILHKAENAKDDPFINVKDLAVSYGILIEKELAIKSIGIEEAKLRIEEAKLAIKEKELEIRIERPEAFNSSVTIINDAPVHEVPDYNNDSLYEDKEDESSS